MSNLTLALWTFLIPKSPWKIFLQFAETMDILKKHCLRTSIGGTTKQYRKFNTIWKKHSNNFALFGSHLPQSFTDISNHFGGIFKSQTVTRNTIDLKNTVAQLYNNIVCISMHLDLGHPFGGILWWEIFWGPPQKFFWSQIVLNVLFEFTNFFPRHLNVNVESIPGICTLHNFSQTPSRCMILTKKPIFTTINTVRNVYKILHVGRKSKLIYKDVF